MKKALSLFLTLLLVFTCFSVNPITATAATKYTDGYYTYTVTDGKATITSVDKSISGDIYIPSDLGGYPVTELGYNAFYNCTNLVSVNIPVSVIEIKNNCFVNCNSLKSVLIPYSVKTIYYYAFSNCAELTTVNLGDGIESISKTTFYNCPKLEYNTFGGSKYLGNKQNPYIALIDGSGFSSFASNVLTIAISAFADNTSISTIEIPNSVKTIGDNAFGNCTALKNIHIGSGLKSISSTAFKNCKFLEKITVDSRNSSYRVEGNCLIDIKTKTVIRGCKNSAIPDYIEKIGDYAFYYCSGLTSITLNNKLKEIGSYSFAGCDFINLTIPDSVTKIGDYAFYYCDCLKKVHIGKSVETIGSSAFRECREITKINLPNSLTTIESGAFYECRSLASIVIPNGVTSIERGTFDWCLSLKTVVIPKSVTHFPDDTYDHFSPTTIYYLGTKSDKEKYYYGSNHGANWYYITPTDEYDLNFDDDSSSTYLIETSRNTFGEKLYYTTTQKNAAGYENYMGKTYYKVKSDDTESFNLPLALKDNQTYLAHFKISAVDALNISVSGENVTADFTASTKNNVLKGNGSVSFGTEDFSEGFVDVYAVIKPTASECNSVYLSIGQENGGEYIIDNLTVKNLTSFAPKMVGATMNPKTDPEGNEIMYVTRIDIPEYLALNKISTYMGVAGELAAAGKNETFTDADNNVSGATLKAYPSVNYITQPSVLTPFRSGDVYATFKGANEAKPTIKYAVRSVIELTDCYGNPLNISVATNNTDGTAQNGIYSRSINQIKRLLARDLMYLSSENAYLAKKMISYSDSPKLYNGPIEQVWAFIVECVNPSGGYRDNPGIFPGVDNEGDDDFI